MVKTYDETSAAWKDQAGGGTSYLKLSDPFISGTSMAMQKTEMASVAASIIPDTMFVIFETSNGGTFYCETNRVISLLQTGSAGSFKIGMLGTNAMLVELASPYSGGNPMYLGIGRDATPSNWYSAKWYYLTT